MAPTLRLLMTERPTLRFGKRAQSQDVDAQWQMPAAKRSELPHEAASAYHLPSFTRLDTGSFVNLFETFQEPHTPVDGDTRDISNTTVYKASTGAITEVESAKAAVSPLDALHSHRNTTSMASKPYIDQSRGAAAVARGNSTASSPSSPADSDNSSNPSKRSSRSSVVDEFHTKSSPARSIPNGRWSARNRFASASHTDSIPNRRWSASNRFATASHTDVIPNRRWSSRNRFAKAPQTDFCVALSPAPQVTEAEGRALLESPRMNKPLPIEPLSSPQSASDSTKGVLKYSTIRIVDPFNDDEEITTPSTPQRPIARHRTSLSSASTPSTGISAGGESPSPRSKRGARLGKAIWQSPQIKQKKSMGAIAAEVRKPANIAGVIRQFPSTPPAVSKSLQTSRETRENGAGISAEAAENILYQVMRRNHNLKDLQSTAMLSRGFYSTFKRHESKLVSEVLFTQSLPTWEALESIHKDTHAYSMRTCKEYMRTLNSLCSTIATTCGQGLNLETYASLIGSNAERKTRFVHALWRIWTFCQLFGGQSDGKGDFEAQIDWLNGGKAARQDDCRSIFGRGNGNGLSLTELEDVSEMWHCLSLLLDGLRNRVDEARLVGVFTNSTFDEFHTEQWHLHEWIQYLLSLGPAVISSIATCSFEHLNALGLTEWTPSSSVNNDRSTFLKAAITHVYQERVMTEATIKAACMALPVRASHRISPTDSAYIAPRMLAELQSIQTETQTFERPNKPVKRKPVSSLPMYNQPSHSESVVATANSPAPPTSSLPNLPAANSTTFHSLAMTPTASTRLGATLFPVESPAPRHSRIPIMPIVTPTMSPLAQEYPPLAAQVIDPVDKALALLVGDMGFAPADAKKALARCDTGFGIDVRRAIELLTFEGGKKVMMVSELDGSSPLSGTRPVRTVSAPQVEECRCDIGCASPQTRNHGNSDSSCTSALSSGGTEEHSSVRSSHASGSGSPIVGRATTKAKAYKFLGVDSAAVSAGKLTKGHIVEIGKKKDRLSMSSLGMAGLGKGLEKARTIRMPGVGIGLQKRGKGRETEMNN